MGLVGEVKFEKNILFRKDLGYGLRVILPILQII